MNDQTCGHPVYYLDIPSVLESSQIRGRRLGSVACSPMHTLNLVSHVGFSPPFACRFSSRSKGVNQSSCREYRYSGRGVWVHHFGVRWDGFVVVGFVRLAALFFAVLVISESRGWK